MKKTALRKLIREFATRPRENLARTLKPGDEVVVVCYDDHSASFNQVWEHGQYARHRYAIIGGAADAVEIATSPNAKHGLRFDRYGHLDWDPFGGGNVRHLQVWRATDPRVQRLARIHEAARRLGVQDDLGCVFARWPDRDDCCGVDPALWELTEAELNAVIDACEEQEKDPLPLWALAEGIGWAHKMRAKSQALRLAREAGYVRPGAESVIVREPADGAALYARLVEETPVGSRPARDARLSVLLKGSSNPELPDGLYTLGPAGDFERVPSFLMDPRTKLVDAGGEGRPWILRREESVVPDLLSRPAPGHFAEHCRATGAQFCADCERVDCCDNTSPAGVYYRRELAPLIQRDSGVG